MTPSVPMREASGMAPHERGGQGPKSLGRKGWGDGGKVWKSVKVTPGSQRALLGRGRANGFWGGEGSWHAIS